MFDYYEFYDSIEWKFLKEMMLTKQVHQNSGIFATSGIS